MSSILDNLDPLDPNDEKEYSVNWYRELVKYGGTIQSSSWPIVPAGITVITHTFNDTSATIWLTGGTVGSNYVFTNRIVTATTPPRTLDQSITIRVRQR